MKKTTTKIYILVILCIFTAQLRTTFAINSDSDPQTEEVQNSNVETGLNNALCTDLNGNSDADCLAGNLVPGAPTSGSGGVSGGGGSVFIPVSVPVTTTQQTQQTTNRNSQTQTQQNNASTQQTATTDTQQTPTQTIIFQNDQTTQEVNTQNNQTQNNNNNNQNKSNKTKNNKKGNNSQNNQNNQTEATPSVLGVSTTRAHSEQEFQDLQSQVQGLKAAAEKAGQQNEQTQKLIAQTTAEHSYETLAYIIFAGILIFLAILGEVRYLKSSRQFLALKQKIRKGAKKKPKK